VRTRAGVRVESGDSAFGLSQTDVALAAFNGEGQFDAAGRAGMAFQQGFQAF
jgi:TRAP-type uncharacterized transport system substrate-binding protein